MKRCLYIVLFLTVSLKAQVGINTTLPQAQLDVQSTDKGILIPRVELTSTDIELPVINPNGGALTESTLVYNTATNGSGSSRVTPGYYYWNGSKWSRFNADTEGKPKYYVALGTTNATVLNNSFSNMPEMNITFTPNSTVVLVNFSASGALIPGSGQKSLFFQLLLDGALIKGFQTTTEDIDNVSNRPIWDLNIVYPVSVTPGIEQTISINWSFPNAPAQIANQVVTPITTGIAGVFFNAHRTLTVIDPNGGGGFETSLPIPTLNETWFLNGNTNTNPSTNFIGTTDNADLVFKRSSIISGRISTSNTSFGVNSHSVNSSGLSNTAFGAFSLFSSQSGSFNTAIGRNALYSNRNNSRSTSIGYNSMYYADNRTTGRETYNTAVGYAALRGSTTSSSNIGRFNTAIGDQASFSNTSGNFNISIGTSALYSNTTGEANSANGASALYSNTTGNQNTAVGTSALDLNQTGNRNTSVGAFSGRFNNTTITTGSNNVYLGFEAGQNNTQGSNNTFIGTNSNAVNSNYSYAVAIGSGAVVESSNAMALGGNTLATRTRVGINVANPLFSLHINQIGSFGLALDNGTNSWEFWNNNTLRMYYNGVERGNFNQTNGVYTSISDRRLKSNIQPLGSLLSKIKKLQPSSYTFIHDNLNRNQIGFIAQELNEIFPEFVYLNKSNETERPEEELYTVDYSGMSVIALKAIQEQQEVIEALEQENQLLKNTIEKIMTRLENLEKK